MSGCITRAGCLAATTLSLWALAGEAPVLESFATGATPTGWTLTGGAAVDLSHSRDGTGGALRLPPGSVALWPLRPENGGGRVEVWVFDDQTRPAQPRDRRVGPRWGLLQADGRVLVVGMIYAPYLSGDTTYTASDSDQKAWFSVQYTAVQRRAGWHRWTFLFDPDQGLTLACDDKVLPANRFDWNRTQIEGFVGVALFGDTGKGDEQTLWVDDVAVTLGGPVRAKPVPPPPPPPVLPAEDPAPETPVSLLPALQGQHPRLLLSAAELPALRARAAGGGKVFFDKMVAYLGACRPQGARAYVSDATDAQRHGYWRAPTVGLHYLLTGAPESLAQAKGFLEEFVATEHWETGAEEDCGMAAANLAVGAGLLYDWLYNDLDPAFRETARQKLLLQARRMYYRGHLMKAGGATAHYWQSDPQNNHRWHRDAGLAAGVLAVAGDGPGDAWILAETRKELQFVVDGLPADGSSHESPSYLVFGASHLVLAMDLADRCLGTAFLEQPFFREVAPFRLQMLAPGLQTPFAYGDAGGVGAYNDFLFRCTRQFAQRDVQAAVWSFHERHWQTRPDGGRGENSAFTFGWLGMLWCDPDLNVGATAPLPTAYYGADLGLACVRDGWAESAVAVFFKCAPYGGHLLNQYRNAKGFRYINIAHDDPDVNQFQIYARGALLACDDGYANKKLTASHNTLLINGKGQKGEGQHWTQPLKGRDQDMAHLGVMTTWKDAGALVVAEGEAAGAYADLERCRRTLIWARGRYILLLDAVQGRRDHEVTWLVQGPTAALTDAATQRFRLARGEVTLDLQVVCDRPTESSLGTSPADDRGTAMGLQQIRVTAQGASSRFAAVFDAWASGGLTVSLTAATAESATVTVSGPGFADTWLWPTAPADPPYAPTPLACRRQDGSTLVVGPADQAAIPGERLPGS